MFDDKQIEEGVGNFVMACAKVCGNTVKTFGDILMHFGYGIKNIGKVSKIRLFVFVMLFGAIGGYAFYMMSRVAMLPDDVLIATITFILVIMMISFLGYFQKLYPKKITFEGNKKRKARKEIATALNNLGMNDYLKIKDIINYSNPEKTEIVLESERPRSAIEANKENLEHELKVTVVGIDNHPSDKKTIVLTVTKRDLPNIVEWSNEYLLERDILLGEDLLGKVKFNFDEVPHLIIAGETGGGKSVAMRNIMIQLLLQRDIHGRPVEVMIADFKGGLEYYDLQQYAYLVKKIEEFDRLLIELLKENEERMKTFINAGCKSIKEYNEKSTRKMRRKVIFLEEITELTDIIGVSEVEEEIMERCQANLGKLAKLSRSMGINLVIGCQIPDPKALPGFIKNNIMGRVCFRMVDEDASKFVIGTTEATKLEPIKGRQLYRHGAKIVKLQGYYVTGTSLKSIKQIHFHSDDKFMKSIRGV